LFPAGRLVDSITPAGENKVITLGATYGHMLLPP
jgi:hypothetical protein